MRLKELQDILSDRKKKMTEKGKQGKKEGNQWRRWLRNLAFA